MLPSPLRKRQTPQVSGASVKNVEWPPQLSHLDSNSGSRPDARNTKIRISVGIGSITALRSVLARSICGDYMDLKILAIRVDTPVDIASSDGGSTTPPALAGAVRQARVVKRGVNMIDENSLGVT